MAEKKLILEAIAGDIIGSSYEFNNVKSTDFDMKKCVCLIVLFFLCAAAFAQVGMTAGIDLSASYSTLGLGLGLSPLPCAPAELVERPGLCVNLVPPVRTV